MRCFEEFIIENSLMTIVNALNSEVMFPGFVFSAGFHMFDKLISILEHWLCGSQLFMK